MSYRTESQMHALTWWCVPAALLITACGSTGTIAPEFEGSRDPIPLTDMGSSRYLDFAGGLYPGGNVMPAEHARLGAEHARRVKPLNSRAEPDPTGKYALLSIGMSNTTQEFCSQSSEPPCDSWTFMGQAAADPTVNRTALVMVNGARAGQAAEAWEAPSHPNYDRIRDTRLAPLGLTEQQVQIVWLKVANRQPAISLPDPRADAYVLERRMGNIVRALKSRYPNLQQVFLSSRIYAGYATSSLNPEPYAYESGFAVKWLIEAQIRQAASGTLDPIAGDLDPRSVAPWLAWGPYLWADGTHPRSDGLIWERNDLAADGTHPSRSGEEKVGRLLLSFLKSSPHSRCWFISGEVCS